MSASNKFEFENSPSLAFQYYCFQEQPLQCYYNQEQGAQDCCWGISNEMEEDDVEIDDRALGRKRTRDAASASSPSAAPKESEESLLENSMKKVRISKQVPGQIRLQQDAGECSTQARQLGIDLIKIDPKNPLTLSMRLSNGHEFVITVGRFYPHQVPVLAVLPLGNRIRLPVLDHWLPVNTVADIITQLNQHGMHD